MTRTVTHCVLLLLCGLWTANLAVAQDTGSAAKARAPVQQPTLKQATGAQRSAQSDCVREANRRGFAVIDTYNFQQFSDGWSIALRVRDQRGRVSQGSCFVETRSGDVSLTGFGWGWDDDGDEQMQFNCSSSEKRYRECQLPVNGRARLVKQRSDSPCIEGRTWGQRGDRVWVDDGCRGRFEVVRHAGGGGGSNRVDCKSDGRYHECRIGSGYFGRLVHEYSKGRCRKESTWGTRNGVIWVTDGCRASFERQRGNFGGSGGGSSGAGASAAKQACTDEARRRGYRVDHLGQMTSIPGGYTARMQVRVNGNRNRALECTYYTSSRQVRLRFLD